MQAAAAAQAGASVIQPNVGRIGDYYTKHPGAIRDPKARSAPCSLCLLTWSLRLQGFTERRPCMTGFDAELKLLKYET